MNANRWHQVKSDWLQSVGLVVGSGAVDLRGMKFTFLGKLTQNRDGKDASRQFVMDFVAAGVGYRSVAEMHVGTVEVFWLLATVEAFGPGSGRFMFDESRNQWEVCINEELYVGEIVLDLD